jgi:hypothetical protein
MFNVFKCQVHHVHAWGNCFSQNLTNFFCRCFQIYFPVYFQYLYHLKAVEKHANKIYACSLIDLVQVRLSRGWKNENSGAQQTVKKGAEKVV